MGRKDIDVIDFSHSSGTSKRTSLSKSERIDVAEFVDSAHSKKDYGRHAHEADFVLPLISSPEGSAWEDDYEDGYADGYDDRYGMKRDLEAMSRRRRHRPLWRGIIRIIKLYV